jgi:lipoyl-dependent peroxiredoxin
MAIAERSASTDWQGDLPHGRGSVNLDSGALDAFEVTWASRTERSEGKTSPEELIAAAHASCFSMALSHGLTEGGNPPDRLDVSATVTLSMDQGPKVTSSHLTVRGVVPGLDADGFAQAAQGAADNCPISGALKGNLDRARLKPSLSSPSSAGGAQPNRPARAPQGRPPAALRRARPASSAACPPSASPAACACA